MINKYVVYHPNKKSAEATNSNGFRSIRFTADVLNVTTQNQRFTKQEITQESDHLRYRKGLWKGETFFYINSPAIKSFLSGRLMRLVVNGPVHWSPWDQFRRPQSSRSYTFFCFILTTFIEHSQLINKYICRWYNRIWVHLEKSAGTDLFVDLNGEKLACNFQTFPTQS